MSILITEFFVLFKITIVTLILTASWISDSHIYFSKDFVLPEFSHTSSVKCFMCNVLAFTSHLHILYGYFEGLPIDCSIVVVENFTTHKVCVCVSCYLIYVVLWIREHYAIVGKVGIWK